MMTMKAMMLREAAAKNKILKPTRENRKPQINLNKVLRTLLNHFQSLRISESNTETVSSDAMLQVDS